MKKRFRRAAPVLVATALLGVGVASGFASATAATPTSILFDPGPKNRCFYTEREGNPETNPTQFFDDSGCSADDNPQRDDASCHANGTFPYQGAQGFACPAWDFITFGWQSSQFTQYPGYDTQVWGASGSPLTLVLQNNTATLGINGNCDLHETTAAYQYPSSGLRRPTASTTYTLANGDLIVSYDAWAEQSGSFHCTEQRAILTTDLIFFDTTHGRKDVISVVHYDPGNFMNAPASPVDGVLWQNGCADNSCRVTVRAPTDQIITTPGTTQHLSINFTALARQLATKYLGGLTIDSGTGIYAVQFVNSTRGADLQTRVSNVNVVLQ